MTKRYLYDGKDLDHPKKSTWLPTTKACLCSSYPGRPDLRELDHPAGPHEVAHVEEIRHGSVVEGDADDGSERARLLGLHLKAGLCREAPARTDAATA